MSGRRFEGKARESSECRTPLAKKFYSREPLLPRVYHDEAHGTEMFNQTYREQFTAELLALLEMLR